jgi:hypothetical protein
MHHLKEGHLKNDGWVYMINCIMFVTTHIFCGQLDNLELTAASLGTNIGLQAYAYGLLVCAMFAYSLITQILANAVPLDVEHSSAQRMDPGGHLWAVTTAQLGWPIFASSHFV